MEAACSYSVSLENFPFSYDKSLKNVEKHSAWLAIFFKNVIIVESFLNF